MQAPIDPLKMLRPQRSIVGMSAILLPFEANGEVDWISFRAHVTRTAAAGLTPAVNMDTGYVNLLDPALRRRVLAETRGVLGSGPFIAGAFVGDTTGAPCDVEGYLRAMHDIQEAGGTPIIFQSHGLTSLPPDHLLETYATFGKASARFLAFELSPLFAPFGRVYDLQTYAGLLQIPACFGAKHSSLNRTLEWQRIQLRDALRPDFLVLTGNDLAIDMVMYGSDYLLGLSTFAPELFARRDAFWAAGDPAFYELNDTLQYLGCFTFRMPVPAYKHSAAQFLKLRGWIETDQTHPHSPQRPASDIEVLRGIADRLGISLAGS